MVMVFGQHYKGVCDPLGLLVVLLEELFSSKIFAVKQFRSSCGKNGMKLCTHCV